MTTLARELDTFRAPFPDNPPGLTGEDVPLYRAFRSTPPIALQLAFFNVRVGPPIEHLAGVSGIDANLVAQLYSPRLDMLTWDGSRWWIIEFHGQAGLPQLGRLDAYPELLCATYPSAPATRSLMIANRVNPFVLPCFTRRRIAVFTYADQKAKPKPENVLRL